MMMGSALGVNAQGLLQPYLSSITAGELSEHVHILASERMEGRYTGSEGQQLAAEYISREFAKDGLINPYSSPQPAYQQAFALDKCYWKETSVSIAGMELDPAEDFTFLGQPGDHSGTYEVVFAGLGLDDSAWSDYEGLEVSGKVVMVFSGEPKSKIGKYLLSGSDRPSRKSGYTSKAETALRMGAKGMVLVSTDQSAFKKAVREAGAHREDPFIIYPGEEEEFFVLYLGLEQAASLAGMKGSALKRAGLKLLNGAKPIEQPSVGKLIISSGKECYPMNTGNVVGYVEGSDKKQEAVVIIAHYDHHGRKEGKIYPGADDNASGTAAVMELAEAFALAAQAGLKPDRSVVFVAATAEEIGLFGSRYYAEHPFISIDSTYACLNIDMIGRVGTRYKDEENYIGGWTYLSPELMDVIGENFEKTSPQLAFRMNFRLQNTGGSDHYYFAKEGVPSAFFFTGIHKDYHSPGDTPDKLLYGRMEMIVRAIFSAAWDLANSEKSLTEN